MSASCWPWLFFQPCLTTWIDPAPGSAGGPDALEPPRMGARGWCGNQETPNVTKGEGQRWVQDLHYGLRWVQHDNAPQTPVPRSKTKTEKCGTAVWAYVILHQQRVNVHGEAGG